MERNKRGGKKRGEQGTRKTHFTVRDWGGGIDSKMQQCLIKYCNKITYRLSGLNVSGTFLST